MGKHQAPNSLVYKHHMLKSQVWAAMQILSSEIQPRDEASSETNIRVLCKPQRGVVAVAPLEPFSLILAPHTLKVVCRTVGDKTNDTSEVPVKIGGSMTVCPNTEVSLQPTFSDTFVVPAWVVKAVAEEDKANVRWEYVRISTVGVAEWPDAVLGRDTTKLKRTVGKHTPALQPVGYEWDVSIPALTNFKHVAGEEELLVYRQKAEKQRKPSRPAPVSTAHLIKQQLGKKAKR
jgi:hypothetical protein